MTTSGPVTDAHGFTASLLLRTDGTDPQNTSFIASPRRVRRLHETP